MKVYGCMLVAGLLAVGQAFGKNPDITTKLRGFVAAGDRAGLTEFLRSECSLELLTESKFSELRAAAQSFGPSPEARLAARKAMHDARDSIVWKSHLITDLANAHDACGELQPFLGSLEKRATGAAAGIQRATAALQLAIIHAGLLDPPAAQAWACVAAEQAPLGWVAARRVRPLDPNTQRLCKIGFIPLDSDQNQLGSSTGFAAYTSFDGTPGGAWTYVNIRREIRRLQSGARPKIGL